MAIEHVGKVSLNPQPQGGRPRLVSAEDAAAMRARPGEWFEIKAASLAKGTIQSAAYRARLNLPRWYGGTWGVTISGGRVYARFLGGQVTEKTGPGGLRP